jgi:hypothetical protein
VGLISTAIISSITLQASTIVVDNASFFETLGDVLTTSTLIAQFVVTSTIVFSTMVTSSLSTSYLVASSIYQLEGGFSTQIGSTVITSTFFTPALNVYDTQSICSMIGSSIAISTLTTSTLYGSNQFFSVLTGPSTTTTNMIATSMINSSIQFSTMYGTTATIPLIYASTLIFPTSYVDSTFSVSSIITTNTYTSSMITDSISVNTYYINQAVYGQTIKKDSIDVFTNVRMSATDFVARVDNPPNTPQLYTIGSTIQNQWIVAGRYIPDYSQTFISIGTSNNGITWSGQTNAYLRDIYGIVWSGSIWVAIGSGEGISIMTSPNGIDWTPRGEILLPTDSSPFTYFYGGGGSIICWGGALYIVGGYNVGYSPDNGTTWYNITGSLTYTVNAIAYNGTRAVVVGRDYNTGKMIAWTDTLGSGTWNIVNDPTFFSSGKTVIWTGRGWVAGGDNNGQINYGYNIVYSYDGITWTGSTNANDIFTYTVNGIGWNGNILVAVGRGDNHTIAISRDGGITWIGQGKTVFRYESSSVTWNGQMWVATGYGPYVGDGSQYTIAYSYDGMAWYGSASSIPEYVGFCVAFNFRRPYNFYFNTQTAQLSSISGSNFPVIVPAGSQLDIISEAYYNKGYTNFSLALQTRAI